MAMMRRSNLCFQHVCYNEQVWLDGQKWLIPKSCKEKSGGAPDFAKASDYSRNALLRDDYVPGKKVCPASKISVLQRKRIKFQVAKSTLVKAGEEGSYANDDKRPRTESAATWKREKKRDNRKIPGQETKQNIRESHGFVNKDSNKLHKDPMKAHVRPQSKGSSGKVNMSGSVLKHNKQKVLKLRPHSAESTKIVFPGAQNNIFDPLSLHNNNSSTTLSTLQRQPPELSILQKLPQRASLVQFPGRQSYNDYHNDDGSKIYYPLLLQKQHSAAAVNLRFSSKSLRKGSGNEKLRSRSSEIASLNTEITSALTLTPAPQHKPKSPNVEVEKVATRSNEILSPLIITQQQTPDNRTVMIWQNDDASVGELKSGAPTKTLEKPVSAEVSQILPSSRTIRMTGDRISSRSVKEKTSNRQQQPNPPKMMKTETNSVDNHQVLREAGNNSTGKSFSMMRAKGNRQLKQDFRLLQLSKQAKDESNNSSMKREFRILELSNHAKTGGKNSANFSARRASIKSKSLAGQSLSKMDPKADGSKNQNKVKASPTKQIVSAGTSKKNTTLSSLTTTTGTRSKNSGNVTSLNSVIVKASLQKRASKTNSKYTPSQLPHASSSRISRPSSVNVRQRPCKLLSKFIREKILQQEEDVRKMMRLSEAKLALRFGQRRTQKKLPKMSLRMQVTPPNLPTPVPSLHRIRPTSTTIELEFTKLLERRSPVIWNFGYTQCSVVKNVQQTLDKLENEFQLHEINLDFEITRWTTSPSFERLSRSSKEPSNFAESVIFHAGKLLREVKGLREGMRYLSSVELCQLLKLAMVSTQVRKNPNGFILRNFPVSAQEGDDFESFFYPCAAGLYFRNNSWSNERASQPEVYRPKYVYRGGIYSEEDVELVAERYGERTIKVSNMDDINPSKIQEIIYALRHNLEVYNKTFRQFTKIKSNTSITQCIEETREQPVRESLELSGDFPLGGLTSLRNQEPSVKCKKGQKNSDYKRAYNEVNSK